MILKRWRCQALASADNLFYQVTVTIRRLPAHAWRLAIARQILSPACSNLQPTPETLARADKCQYTIRAWCIHPDLISREKTVYIPEPEPVHARGPPLFLDPEEINYPNRPTLCYWVILDVLEVVD
jgi:hypothetical protein